MCNILALSTSTLQNSHRKSGEISSRLFNQSDLRGPSIKYNGYNAHVPYGPVVYLQYTTVTVLCLLVSIHCTAIHSTSIAINIL